MTIQNLSIRNSRTKPLELSWSLSEGVQSSYDLFLIQGGSVVERVRASTAAMKCTLHTLIEPKLRYDLLLTVRCGLRLSTVRAGIVTDFPESH